MYIKRVGNGLIIILNLLNSLWLRYLVFWEMLLVYSAISGLN